MKTPLKMTLALTALLFTASPAMAWKCCKIKIRPPSFIPLPKEVRKVLPRAITKPIDKINEAVKKIDPTPTIVIGGSKLVDVEPNRVAEENLKKVFVDPVMRPIEKNRALLEKMNRISTCLRTACLSEYLAARELAKAKKKEERIYREFIEAESRRQSQELTAEEQQRRDQMLADARATFAASQSVSSRADISNTLGKVFGHLLLAEVQNRSLKITAQNVTAENANYQVKLRELLDSPDFTAGQRLESLYAQFEANGGQDQMVLMQAYLATAADSDLQTLKDLRAAHLALVNEAAAMACEDGLAALDLMESQGEQNVSAPFFRQFCSGDRS